MFSLALTGIVHSVPGNKKPPTVKGRGGLGGYANLEQTRVFQAGALGAVEYPSTVLA